LFFNKKCDIININTCQFTLNDKFTDNPKTIIIGGFYHEKDYYSYLGCGIDCGSV
jgi:hypothetical protein